LKQALVSWLVLGARRRLGIPMSVADYGVLYQELDSWLGDRNTWPA